MDIFLFLLDITHSAHTHGLERLEEFQTPPTVHFFARKIKHRKRSNLHRVPNASPTMLPWRKSPKKNKDVQ